MTTPYQGVHLNVEGGRRGPRNPITCRLKSNPGYRIFIRKFPIQQVLLLCATGSDAGKLRLDIQIGGMDGELRTNKAPPKIALLPISGCSVIYPTCGGYSRLSR